MAQLQLAHLWRQWRYETFWQGEDIWQASFTGTPCVDLQAQVLLQLALVQSVACFYS